MIVMFGLSKSLYLMAKPNWHNTFGVMYSKPEVDFVFIFGPKPGTMKAFQIAFEWIKPTLTLCPTIEEGQIEWSSIDSFMGEMYVPTINRPLSFRFEQLDPINTDTIMRTDEYKQMLNFIHHGFHETRLWHDPDPELVQKFLVTFLNEHRDYEEYKILLGIIFALAEEKEIELSEVIDKVVDTENKEALLIMIQKNDDLRMINQFEPIKKEEVMGRFNL